MSQTAVEFPLFEQALALPAAQREELLQRLVESLVSEHLVKDSEFMAVLKERLNYTEADLCPEDALETIQQIRAELEKDEAA